MTDNGKDASSSITYYDAASFMFLCSDMPDTLESFTINTMSLSTKMLVKMVIVIAKHYQQDCIIIYTTVYSRCIGTYMLVVV